MTRTTVAVTTLSGSPAINVIASTAKAGVNIRVMVGDTVAGVLEHVRRAIGDDRVQIDVLDRNEPSPVSPPTTRSRCSSRRSASCSPTPCPRRT